MTTKYTQQHVGMIHYSSYWRTYSLVLDVDGIYITELDKFGEINHNGEHKVRRHCTQLDHGDKFMTVAEFYQKIK
jgi:hypothetical protein